VISKQIINSCVQLAQYSQQHVRLYKTVKIQQSISNLIYLVIKHRFDWKYLTVGTNLSCSCPYINISSSNYVDRVKFSMDWNCLELPFLIS
jgi:hypothetical protein